MQVKLEPSWKELLSTEFDKEYFKKLTDFVRQEYLDSTVYPPAKFIFNALDSTPVDRVKVVILGQDPYHGPNQAHGLSFSVPENVPVPPSLLNIYKEIESDLGTKRNGGGNLQRWADQGVLLLNATLTVRANQPLSHHNRGWEVFTDTIISKISQAKNNLVFLLWGSNAQKKIPLITTNKNHLILKAPHPSPLSAYNGFFGCRHFSQTNIFLLANGLEPINWWPLYPS